LGGGARIDPRASGFFLPRLGKTSRGAPVEVAVLVFLVFFMYIFSYEKRAEELLLRLQYLFF
jgi:hypothetical protein